MIFLEYVIYNEILNTMIRSRFRFNDDSRPHFKNF